MKRRKKHPTHRPGAKRPGKALAKIERPESADSDLLQISEGIRVGVGGRREIIIDTTQLASPRNRYDADFAWVEHEAGSSVSLYFGKRDRNMPEALKSRLQIRYPPEDFVRHFWYNSRKFQENVKRVLTTWPRQETRGRLEPEKWISEKDHSEWVNFDYMAFAGTQAAVDFFHLAIGGVARYTRGQGTAGLELEAVVRVQMTLGELGRLLEACSPVVDIIEGYLPKGTPDLIDDDAAVQKGVAPGPARGSEPARAMGREEEQ